MVASTDDGVKDCEGASRWLQQRWPGDNGRSGLALEGARALAARRRVGRGCRAVGGRGCTLLCEMAFVRR